MSDGPSPPPGRTRTGRSARRHASSPPSCPPRILGREYRYGRQFRGALGLSRCVMTADRRPAGPDGVVPGGRRWRHAARLLALCPSQRSGARQTPQGVHASGLGAAPPLITPVLRVGCSISNARICRRPAGAGNLLVRDDRRCVRARFPPDRGLAHAWRSPAASPQRRRTAGASRPGGDAHVDSRRVHLGHRSRTRLPGLARRAARGRLADRRCGSPCLPASPYPPDGRLRVGTGSPACSRT